ncbi:hypothetical protein [Streptomyces marianii]|uniref:DUF4258 domain-containing protein n=1 Tax=Streptomyces marianii TaxID=1817406 RepID=A0A5R9E8I6_9ACTN|nr:hypothetical protein [Streptomyces marianii]TLQ45375.1 hypothetical protein FEF34_22240 [Streptomyces marianii]
MAYRLKYGIGTEAVHDAMPPAESEQLALAPAAACEDPIGATEVYGEDDGVVRMLVTEHVIAVLLVGQATKTLIVPKQSYTG